MSSLNFAICSSCCKIRLFFCFNFSFFFSFSAWSLNKKITAQSLSFLCWFLPYRAWVWSPIFRLAFFGCLYFLKEDHFGFVFVQEYLCFYHWSWLYLPGFVVKLNFVTKVLVIFFLMKILWYSVQKFDLWITSWFDFRK